MLLTATTTAWGNGDTLDTTLARIATHDPDVTVVELAIGARPVTDPSITLGAWAHRFTYLAHHSAPVGNGHIVRPDLTTDPNHVAETLRNVGISTYSGHPPPRRHCNDDEFWSWATAWWETLGTHGITWSVETMYTPRTRDEHEATGGYHLATPAEIWKFCTRAVNIGWTTPLLVDVSHLHIGWAGGTWTEQDIDELLAHGPADELHLSTNDGRRDLHTPAGPGDRVAHWAAPHLDRYTYVVDEGRRHTTPVPHTAPHLGGS